MISGSHKSLAVAGTATNQAPFGSNCVRLSGYEWFIVAVVVSALFYFVPVFWEHIEKFEPGTDYRLPYKLSNDYWLYRRYCQVACSREKTLVIGDSVVWGHYVSKENTLSGYLNKITYRDMFVNMGVDGIHPVALEGLLRYYGRDITGKDIILHFNPLWMSSKKHDLQIEKEFNFNHPKLVPQFVPNIPCYKVSYSKRISAVMQRYMSFFSWVSHLRISFFENMDLPTWTLEHPYENPLKSIMLELPASDDYNLSENVSWREKVIGKQDLQWIKPESSLQWKSFHRSIETLRKRKNRIFVLVGPFNEHVLSERSLNTYRKIKREIEAWLQRNNVPYYVPAALPSRIYRDASHPLSEGYAELARQLSGSAYSGSDRVSSLE